MNQTQLVQVVGISNQAVSKTEANEGNEEVSFKSLNKFGSDE